MAGRTIVREARTDGSYLSAHDPRVVVGLEGLDGPLEVRILWPGEPQAQVYGGLERRRYHVAGAGTGVDDRDR